MRRHEPLTVTTYLRGLAYAGALAAAIAVFLTLDLLSPTHPEGRS